MKIFILPYIKFIVISILLTMIFLTGSFSCKAETDTPINDQIVQLDHIGTTRLVVGTRSGPPAGAVLQGLIHFNDDNPRGAEWTKGWTDINATITWKVKAESLGQYELGMVYRCKKGSSGSTFEIATGNAKVMGKVRETRSPYFSNSWELVELDGILSLPAGISTITLRATDKPVTADVVMDLFSLELTPLSAKQDIENEKYRAKKARADTDWFVAAKYGLMVHWIPESQPPQGPPKSYEEAVNDFDVENFSKMISETGAGYIIFHIAGHKMPAPIKAWAEVHGPESTTERDLIADLSDALAQHDIKLILGQGLPEVGLFWQAGQEQHVKRFIRIYTEIGLRYGKKLAGAYFDGGRELSAFNVNWEGMFRACKAGNPDRLLSYNFWVFPLSTDWLDFWTGEGGFPHINFEGRYIKDGAGKGLQAHVMFPIDDDHRWWFKDQNHKIGQPVYPTKQVIEWVRDSEKKGVVPTFNIAIYQDGSVSSETLEQLKAVKRAIKGDDDNSLENKSFMQREPLHLSPDDVTVLMADRSNLSGGPKYNELDPGKPFKRFWIDNWKSPEASIEWNITVPRAGKYEAVMLIEGAPGVEVEITGPNNTLMCKLISSGWDKVIVPGELSLPQGSGIITVRLIEAADVNLKSVELINIDAKKDIDQRVKNFRSSTKWLANAKYGLMFQWGEWGYPRHGDKKKWPKMIDDFDVESFADMVADTHAGYVIWSATWTTYYFPAPIKAIDNILPGRTSKRDLISELANALDKRGIRLIVYYHLGHDNNPNLDWWKKNWDSSDDKETFFTNLCAITTEIGNRYGSKLSGWMIDDGVVIYPAPFERLGKALKAGNPDRIIAYNSWIMPRFTEFQDFHFGEGNEQGSAGIGPKGGDGIVAYGPQKGLQGHANFILDGPNWGIRTPETKINPPRWTKDQVAKMVQNAMEHKLALSFNLLMYEDGSVSPTSLEMMRYVHENSRGK